MMDHFIIAAQTGIFIFNGIKTMGAAGYYLFNIVAIEYVYIHHRLHLEQEFISRTFGRVAGTAFLGTQNRETDAHMVQYLANITGDLLRTFIKTTCTAHPKQYFWFQALRGHF